MEAETVYSSVIRGVEPPPIKFECQGTAFSRPADLYILFMEILILYDDLFLYGSSISWCNHDININNNNNNNNKEYNTLIQQRSLDGKNQHLKTQRCIQTPQYRRPEIKAAKTLHT